MRISAHSKVYVEPLCTQGGGDIGGLPVWLLQICKKEYISNQHFHHFPTVPSVFFSVFKDLCDIFTPKFICIFAPNRTHIFNGNNLVFLLPSVSVQNLHVTNPFFIDTQNGCK